MKKKRAVKRARIAMELCEVQDRITYVRDNWKHYSKVAVDAFLKDVWNDLDSIVIGVTAWESDK